MRAHGTVGMQDGLLALVATTAGLTVWLHDLNCLPFAAALLPVVARSQFLLIGPQESPDLAEIGPGVGMIVGE